MANAASSNRERKNISLLPRCEIAPNKSLCRRQYFRTLTRGAHHTTNSLVSCRRLAIHYNIMLRPEPEGGYTALVPALPGCVTHGRTIEEAQAMAKDALSGYVASLRKHGDPIPTAEGRFSKGGKRCRP